jgi:hypothetical protein
MAVVKRESAMVLKIVAGNKR